MVIGTEQMLTQMGSIPKIRIGNSDLKRNMGVFKEVICQLPPFGTNFPKRDSSLSKSGA